LSLQFPPSQPYTIQKVFQGKAKDLTSLLNKIFVYEPHKRINALEVLAHPFFDELRMIDSFNNGKFVVPQIFDFSESEINLYSNQKSLLKKIIPEWSENYKLLL
jgi:serine/threonine protein kinase